MISGVEGAPGDGGQSLPWAIAEILKRQNVAIVTDPQATADLVLDADVVVANPKAGKQNVKIVWRVRRKDGGEIGTVGQETTSRPGCSTARGAMSPIWSPGRRKTASCSSSRAARRPRPASPKPTMAAPLRRISGPLYYVI